MNDCATEGKMLSNMDISFEDIYKDHSLIKYFTINTFVKSARAITDFTIRLLYEFIENYMRMYRIDNTLIYWKSPIKDKNNITLSANYFVSDLREVEACTELLLNLKIYLCNSQYMFCAGTSVLDVKFDAIKNIKHMIIHNDLTDEVKDAILHFLYESGYIK